MLRLQRPQKSRRKNSCHPVKFEWFSIQILVNSKLKKKLSLNLSFTHLRAQIVCYEKKIEPRNARGNISFTSDLYGNHARMTG